RWKFHHVRRRRPARDVVPDRPVRPIRRGRSSHRCPACRGIGGAFYRRGLSCHQVTAAGRPAARRELFGTLRLLKFRQEGSGGRMESVAELIIEMPNQPTAAASNLAFLEGGGAVGALMRAHDWSTSPLGPPETWPQSLRSVVGLLLQSKFPMFVAWGKEL